MTTPLRLGSDPLQSLILKLLLFAFGKLLRRKTSLEGSLTTSPQTSPPIADLCEIKPHINSL